LILGTSILIAVERRGRRLDAIIDDKDDVAIAAVTAAELLVGVELASGRRRSARKAFVDTLLQTVPLEPYDMDVARAHAGLLAWTRRSGRQRGAHDLIIAATALARERVVITADTGGFDGLPLVSIRSP
jgi:tRNA(fMet)-specific endonuclease VapC